MYQYRLCTLADIPWLDQAVALCAWESLSPDERRSTSPAEVAVRAQERARWVLGSGSGAALVAQFGPWPVGFILAAIIPEGSTEEPQGYILELWVDPVYRRRGVARQLQTLVEQWMERLGIRKMKMWAGLHNQPLLMLTQALGYSPEGVVQMKPL